MVLVTTASAARAQEWLNLNPFEGEVFFEFDGRWTDSDGTARDLEFQEGVRLRQRGNILDPGIATFDLELQPTFSQGQSRQPGPGDNDRDGFFLDYAGNVSLLHGTPSPVALRAGVAQNTGDIDGDLGARTEFSTLRWNVDLDLRTPAFPSTFSYNERYLDQDFRSAFSTTSSKRDDVLRTATYKGRSSKMELFVEGNWFDDRERSERSYDTQQSRLTNFFRWGKGSNWTSQIDYFDRNKFNAYERLSMNQSGRLQHTRNLYSTYAYRFQELDQDLADTTLHTGDFGLTHQLFKNLTTTLSLSGSHQDADEVGTEDRYASGLDLTYTKNVFWDGNITANAGGGYNVTDRDTEDGILQVNNESQVVPPTGVVTLDNQFIDINTIVVTDSTDTQVFAEGVDYDVQSASNNLTQLIILPGGQINVGDTILVDYQFEVQPSVKFYGIPFRAGLRFDFGWISLFVRVDGEEQNVISGEDQSVVSDRRTSRAGLELRWSDSATRADFRGQRVFIKSGGFNSDEFSFNETLTHRISRQASLSLNANQSFFDSNDDVQVDVYTADLYLNWLPLPNLTLRPHVGGFYRNDKDGTDEQFINSGLDLSWFWRKLKVDLRYNHDFRSGSSVSDTHQDRVLFTLTRRF